MRRTSILLRTAAVATGIVLLLDTLRVWLPSIMFVYGRAGTTPATEMGAFALVPFLLAFGGALAVRVLPSQMVAAVAASALAVTRLALQATQGGDAQLWVSTVGVLAGLVWLLAVAGGAAPRRTAAVGLVLGLAADATVHALLRSTGLAWRAGPLPWVALLVFGMVLLAGSWRRWPPDRRSHKPWIASALGWLLVGPVLTLHGIVGGMVSHLHTVSGWPEPAAVGLVVGGHGLGAAAGCWAVASGRGRAAGRVGAVVILAGLGAALARPPFPGPVGGVTIALAAGGHVLLPIGTALAIGGLISVPGTTGDARRAVACGVGLLGFLGLAFGYYAASDMALPFANELLLWLAASLVAVGAIAAPGGAGEARRGPVRHAVTGIAGALVLALFAATIAAVVVRPAEPTAGDGPPARVLTYNLQMGFDIHGRHSVDRLVAVIAEDEPVVVGLQEVSRGWLINSSTDVLPRLAEQTGMTYAFAPAADAVWGNAILSRHPLRVIEDVALPQGRAPMRRSAQAVVVDLGGGEELGVVNTHLAHRGGDAALRAEQVAVIDDLARRLADGGRPVVVLGDLNAEPGSPELAPLEAWLSYAWDEPPAGTWPSWAPSAHLDHILVSDGLLASDFRVGDSRASDHLPVSATLDRR